MDLEKVSQDFKELFFGVGLQQPVYTLMVSDKACGITPDDINTKEALKKISDYVIIDSAAGLGEEALSAIKVADELIIVTNPEMPAITDALKTIKFAEEINKPVLGVIISRARRDNIEMQPETVKEMLEAEILGMVPEDTSVRKSLNLKDAVVHTYPKSKSARAYKEIAAKLLDVEYDSDKDRESFWKRLFGRE